MERFCTERSKNEMKIGDILLFKISNNEQHIGIVTDIGMIHAFQGPDVVCEHELTNWWIERISGVYTFTGDTLWQQ